MSKSTCRTRQKRSLDSWYNATLSTLIQFSEWIIHIRTVLTALWQKYYHCIQLSYLLNVTISCQTQRQNNDYSKTCRIHCAISHSPFHHAHAHRKVHGSSLNNCRSFYSQFEFWNLAKIILFGSSFRLTSLVISGTDGHFSRGSRSYGFVAIISGISPGEAALMALSP